MIELESVDLILFAGQSNMAGRGCAAEATACPEEAGWAYRAVSAPDALYPIGEPFGRDENVPGAIDDGEKKTGSMVSAFAAAYHRLSGRQVVCVSASQGGTSSQEWADGLAADAAARLARAQGYLRAIARPVQRTFVLWCQGETDGDHAVTAAQYRGRFERIWARLRQAGAERCGLIEIGHFNRRVFPQGLYGLTGEQLDAQYAVIRAAQRQIVREVDGVFLAGSFEGHEAEMKDEFHYRQSAYNAVGAAAARECLLAMRPTSPSCDPAQTRALTKKTNPCLDQKDERSGMQ